MFRDRSDDADLKSKSKEKSKLACRVDIALRIHLNLSVECVLRTLFPRTVNLHRHQKGAWDAPYACYTHPTY